MEQRERERERERERGRREGHAHTHSQAMSPKRMCHQDHFNVCVSKVKYSRKYGHEEVLVAWYRLWQNQRTMRTQVCTTTNQAHYDQPSALQLSALRPNALRLNALRPSALRPSVLRPSALRPSALQLNALRPSASGCGHGPQLQMKKNYGVVIAWYKT
jgi:hypothetical protein